jgi:hypothetical protein
MGKRESHLNVNIVCRASVFQVFKLLLKPDTQFNSECLERNL